MKDREEEATAALGRIGDARAIEPLIEMLADARLMDEEQWAVERSLLCFGRVAIAPLSGHVSDSRERVGPLTYRAAARHSSSRAPHTMGQACEALLYEIIAGPQGDPFWRNGWMPYRVTDWGAWLDVHRGKSLDEIRREVLEYNRFHTSNPNLTDDGVVQKRVRVLIEKLTDRTLHWGEQDAVRRELILHGRLALGPLVEHVGDKRKSWVALGNDDGWNPGRGYHSVGELCEKYLYEIIANPEGRTFMRMGVLPYRVGNWSAWLEEHKDMTLEQIRTEVLEFLTEHQRKQD